ncbi:hypothetical protein [Cobetia amphilecti]|uniref:hypothetical protein n=1 Tax=Cobetia amphilecti TaxID=1055104 RepID=UPI001C0A0B60|nr:hypothetical protein [Cobetia amphilecti]MBU3008593.1 hypothetical protein [Cobetia amphilecti]
MSEADKGNWREISSVYEDLLCIKVGLSKPLSRHGKLLNSIKTLVSALSPSLKHKDDVSRRPDRSKTQHLRLDYTPIGHGCDSRNRVRINPGDVTLLWNAILLQGIFGEPKVVIQLLEQEKMRTELVEWARELFFERQSLAGLGLLRQELIHLLERLPDADLKTEELPNPFADALPQMGLGHLQGNVLKGLAAQTAALSQGDSMMAAYLSGDLEKAYQQALPIETDNEVLAKYRKLIIRRYEDATSFDELLDTFRKKDL